MNHLSVHPLSELASALEERRRKDEVLLVGIDGRGGSGKSTLVRSLGRLIEGSVVIEFDDFYRPSATRLASGDPDIGGNFEWRRLRDQVLVPLSQGNEAQYQRYDWETDSMAEWHAVQAQGIVLIEGNYSTRDELRDYYDFRIWVQAPEEVRLARGVERGGENTRDRWLNEWMPEEERYLAAQEPWRYADLVIDGDSREDVDPSTEYVEGRRT
jgi:uridine kinase